jgi:hypothetical protein
MATTDWISSDEGKLALNIPVADTTFNAELAVYISAVSQRLDQLAGAAVTRTVTAEAHDSDGGPFIQLNYRPVTAVTSVTEYTGTTARVLAAETNAAKTAYDYLLDGEVGWLRRRASGSDALFPVGRGNVVITYTAGRAANTAAVAERFKLAASIYLSHLWRREQGAGTATFGAFEGEGGIPSFGIPNVIRDLLANEIMPVIA